MGQCELMYTYDKLFGEYHHTTAQILLTRDVLEQPQRKQNAMNTFERLLALGAIPIVNENDTVSTEEIEFGDNDTLSAIVARLASGASPELLYEPAGRRCVTRRRPCWCTKAPRPRFCRVWKSACLRCVCMAARVPWR